MISKPKCIIAYLKESSWEKSEIWFERSSLGSTNAHILVQLIDLLSLSLAQRGEGFVLVLENTRTLNEVRN